MRILFSFIVFSLFSLELISNEIEKFYVLEYGTSFFPRDLVNTLEKTNRVKFAWLFYYLEDSRGNKILIDTGFENSKFAKDFGINDFKSPDFILKENGIDPLSITDIVITHSHFDHIGGINLFPNANLYINKKEFESFKRKKNEYSVFEKNMDNRIKKAKLFLVEEQHLLYDRILIQWIGGHTVGSQIVRFKIESKDYIITGDECYFIDACLAKVPLPKLARFSNENNFKFLQSISNEKILTMHDPMISKDNKNRLKEIYVNPKP